MYVRSNSFHFFPGFANANYGRGKADEQLNKLKEHSQGYAQS